MLRTLIVTAALSALVPQIAAACGNEVEISTKDAKKLVLRAEKALAEGKYNEALDMLHEHFVRDQALGARIIRVEAVAYLRTDRISIGIEMLQQLLKEQPDDPYLRTRIAEGQTLLGKNKEQNRKRALKTLEELERADLIPDAEGYLVLARLRSGAGDQAGSERALSRCRQRSTDPARCVLPPTAAKEAGGQAHSG